MAIFRDFQIDTLLGGWKITAGDLVKIYDQEAVAQACRIALATFQGEVWSDEDAGLPYFDEILIKNPNASAVRGYFRQAILGVTGISEITALALDSDRVNRKLTVTWSAISDLGELIENQTTTLDLELS